MNAYKCSVSRLSFQFLLFSFVSFVYSCISVCMCSFFRLSFSETSIYFQPIKDLYTVLFRIISLANINIFRKLFDCSIVKSRLFVNYIPRVYFLHCVTHDCFIKWFENESNEEDGRKKTPTYNYTRIKREKKKNHTQRTNSIQLMNKLFWLFHRIHFLSWRRSFSLFPFFVPYFCTVNRFLSPNHKKTKSQYIIFNTKIDTFDTIETQRTTQEEVWEQKRESKKKDFYWLYRSDWDYVYI